MTGGAMPSGPPDRVALAPHLCRAFTRAARTRRAPVQVTAGHLAARHKEMTVRPAEWPRQRSAGNATC